MGRSQRVLTAWPKGIFARMYIKLKPDQHPHAA
jgi:hypothetical protein